MVDYLERNRAHLAPWEPDPPLGFYTDSYWRERLVQIRREEEQGRQLRVHLFERDARAPRIIGTIGLSNIVRGAFHGCNLGYALDQPYEGQALMTEALRCAIGEVFSPRINLHRIQAAYRPENWRSAEVLKRLNFHDEGVCPDYLFIDGAWRVHRLVALLNRHFVEPTAWRQAV